MELTDARDCATIVQFSPYCRPTGCKQMLHHHGRSSCCSSCCSSLSPRHSTRKLLVILPLVSARALIAVTDGPTIPQPAGPPLDADLLTPTFRTPRLDKSQKADGIATGVATILNAAATNHCHHYHHHRHHRHHHTQQSWAPVVNLGLPKTGTTSFACAAKMVGIDSLHADRYFDPTTGKRATAKWLPLEQSVHEPGPLIRWLDRALNNTDSAEFMKLGRCSGWLCEPSVS